MHKRAHMQANLFIGIRVGGSTSAASIPLTTPAIRSGLTVIAPPSRTPSVVSLHCSVADSRGLAAACGDQEQEDEEKPTDGE